uniref:Transmembrane protein 208 n=2 Tax=Lygus hesperus TaxID=30085 RepID=A0A0K8S4R6_LYGHE
MPPKKGKEGTKGQKQIVEENQDTLKFYRMMVLGANGIFIAVTLIFFDLFSFFNIAMLVMTSLTYFACLYFMSYMAKATFNEKNQVIDSGVDLNMEGGIAEHVKDMMILTSGSQLLSLLSNYFWLLMLLAPGRGMWFLWKNILSPYFFQAAPEQPEVDEKKQKKLERKMRRAQH